MKRFSTLTVVCSPRLIFHPICIVFSIFFLSAVLYPQKISIISPEETAQSYEIVDAIENGFLGKLEVVDRRMSDSLFVSSGFENRYNLTTEDSIAYGSRVGCNFFVLIKTETMRRSSFEREKYFESYLASYLVSTRSGKLVFWKFSKFEDADSPENSRRALVKSIDSHVSELLEKIASTQKQEIAEDEAWFSELPDADSKESIDLRPPLPYRRITPPYTELAAIYDIAATIDIAVEIDASGRVTRTEILRWAGFGLDESVMKTVNEMNWRAADRHGESLPMRILLRYNFRRIDSDK